MDETAVLRVLASHQCGPDLIPGPGILCGLRLLLVLVSTLRVLLLVFLVFPPPQKPTLPISISIGNYECHRFVSHQTVMQPS